MHWRKATYIGYVACLLALAGGARLCAAEISISRASDMTFGQLVSSTFGGTVTVSTAGLRTAVGVPVVASSSSSAASFLITGDNNASYSIILPSSATLSGSGSDMTLDTLTCDPTDSGTLSGTGSQTVYIGGTLHVGANQQACEYSGTIEVSVAYE